MCLCVRVKKRELELCVGVCQRQTEHPGRSIKVLTGKQDGHHHPGHQPQNSVATHHQERLHRYDPVKQTPGKPPPRGRRPDSVAREEMPRQWS